LHHSCPPGIKERKYQKLTPQRTKLKGVPNKIHNTIATTKIIKETNLTGFINCLNNVFGFITHNDDVNNKNIPNINGYFVLKLNGINIIPTID